MKIVVKKLIWDGWNVAQRARHDVVPEEVEEVFRGTWRSFESYDGRFEVIRETQQGRILLVVLDPEPEPGVYYLVTAHTANRKDRTFYQEWKETGGEAA